MEEAHADAKYIKAEDLQVPLHAKSNWKRRLDYWEEEMKGIERQKTLENLNNMLSKRYLHQEEDTAARNLRINETERVPKQSQLLQKSIGAKLVVQRTKQENY